MSLLLLFGGAAVAPSLAQQITVTQDVSSVRVVLGEISHRVVVFQRLGGDLGHAIVLDQDLVGTRAVAWALLRHEIHVDQDVSVRPRGRRRRVVAVDQHGNFEAELSTAIMGPVVDALNEPMKWSFTIGVSDPKASVVLDPTKRFREYQLWRGDQLLTWGPAERPSVSGAGDVRVEGFDCLYYPRRRFVGKAQRTNYVTNGGFEDGLSGWTPGQNVVFNGLGTDNASPPPTATIVQNPTLVGDRAMRLVGGVDGADIWFDQTFLWTTDPVANPDGDAFTFKAYAYLESFTAPAFEERGLFIARYSTTELDPDPIVQTYNPGQAKVLEYGFVPIDEEFPVGAWTRLEYTLELPATGVAEIVNVRLYAPHGSIVWDEAALTLDEATRFYGADQTSEIAAGLIEHMQDPAYDKSDLNISTDCPPSGVLRDRVYVHHEHPNIARSLDELVQLRNGFDESMRYTPTERIYVTTYPAAGAYRPRRPFNIGGNCKLEGWSWDGSSAASSVLSLGQGSGSDREEGSAVDTSTFADGVTIEKVTIAAPETPIDALDDYAAEDLAVSRSPSVLLLTTFPNVDFIGRLRMGDVHPVNCRDGAFVLESVRYRIVALTLNPDDTYKVTMNERDVTA